jgi:FecR protein
MTRIQVLVMVLCVQFTPVLFAANQAGEVVKVIGRVSAAATDGDIRALVDGNAVNTGDTVVTSINSFARMKLTDGGYIVLRPNTRFQIADYNYAEKPAENRSVFNLLKGGFRAVTGLIGQRNRGGVSYRTAVATIGIRGTDLEAIDCTDGCPDLGTDVKRGLYFKVHKGAIDVGNLEGGEREEFDAGKGGIAELDGKITLDTSFDWAKYGCPDCGS